jgi:hypothetical protein
MHAAQRSQKRAERRACPFTTVTVNLAHAIAIVSTCPRVLSVIDGCMLTNTARRFRLPSKVVPLTRVE